MRRKVRTDGSNIRDLPFSLHAPASFQARRVTWRRTRPLSAIYRFPAWRQGADAGSSGGEQARPQAGRRRLLTGLAA